MTDTTYNGWTNYETWLVKLWIDNDQGAQEYWQERATEIAEDEISNEHDDVAEAQSQAAYRLARDLEAYHDEFRPETVGVYADLLTSALGMVDWDEIARSMLDDLEIDWQPAQDDEAA